MYNVYKICINKFFSGLFVFFSVEKVRPNLLNIVKVDPGVSRDAYMQVINKYTQIYCKSAIFKVMVHHFRKIGGCLDGH